MKSNILKYGLIAGTIIVMIPVITGLIIGYGPDILRLEKSLVIPQ